MLIIPLTGTVKVPSTLTNVAEALSFIEQKQVK